MSITIYPNQFKMRENSQYIGLNAIKGDAGAEGPAGRGVGEGTFAPIVLIQAAEPAVPVENLMWIENTDTVTVGEVIVGVDDTLPSTKPDSTALTSGDVYIWNGSRNNHPVVWGNVTVFPLRVWLYSGSAWVAATAQVYVNSQWYPTACQWIIENGKIVGEFDYGSWATVTEREGYLEVAVLYNSTSGRHCMIKPGNIRGQSAVTYPMKFVLDGEVQSYGEVYLGLSTTSAPTTSTSGPTGFTGYAYSSTAQVTLHNIASTMMTTSQGAQSIFSVKANNDRAQVSKIRNLYIVFAGAVPNVDA